MVGFNPRALLLCHVDLIHTTIIIMISNSANYIATNNGTKRISYSSVATYFSISLARALRVQSLRHAIRTPHVTGCPFPSYHSFRMALRMGSELS